MGVNLSNDPYLPFNTDIDGQVRSNQWDIGADEYFTGQPKYKLSPGGTMKIDGTIKFK